MPYLSDARPLIQDAFEKKYTIPAMNVCSAEMVRACVEAAHEENAPLILQTYPADILQIAREPMVALVKSYADSVDVPIALHMDHGESFDMDIACIRAGYSSVMLDGESMPTEEVIGECRRLAYVAHIAGVAVEVGAESFNVGKVQFTKPENALRLKEEGHADMIAVSIGTEHGQKADLQIELLKDICEGVKHPLVIHGGSGVSAEEYAEARKYGVVKANIGAAQYRTLRAVWNASHDAANHREVYERVRAALKAVVKEKIVIMGAAGQA